MLGPATGLRRAADTAPASCCRARPGGLGALVGRRGVAGLRGGDRRRRAYRGLGGASGRHRRAADRRRGGRARRARAVDPARPPGRRSRMPREDGRDADACLRRPGHRRARPARPTGELIHVLDMSVDERLRRCCATAARSSSSASSSTGSRRPGPSAAAVPGTSASTERAMHPAGARGRRRTADRLPRHRRRRCPARQLLAMPLGPERLARPVGRAGRRARTPSWSGLDADDAGHLLLLVWNVDGGRSEVELLDTRTDQRRTRARAAGRGGHRGAAQPRRQPASCWRSRGRAGRARCGAGRGDRTSGPRATARSPVPLPDGLVAPELVTLPGPRRAASCPAGCTGCPVGREPGPAMLSLHGGPEAQERPGVQPAAPGDGGGRDHRVRAEHPRLVRFRPGVRPRRRRPRPAATRFDDVIVCARYLARRGVADPRRIAVTGRSYGGYLTLASLAFTPGCSRPAWTSAGCRTC